MKDNTKITLITVMCSLVGWISTIDVTAGFLALLTLAFPIGMIIAAE